MRTSPLPSVTSAAAVAAAAVAARPVSLPARALELLLLFVVLPAAVRAGLVPGPRLLVLAAVATGCVLLLAADPGFDRRRLWSAGGLSGQAGGVALRAAIAALVIAGLVLWLEPARLLAMPRERPWLWLAGLALYPLVSAWPQEVVYRVFFFHRYRDLFPGPRSALAANAVAFAVLHLVYPNAVAPLLSLPAGLVLGWTYLRTRRLGPVWLEHSIYGVLLFTLGLGRFFYDGRG